MVRPRTQGLLTVLASSLLAASILLSCTVSMQQGCANQAWAHGQDAGCKICSSTTDVHLEQSVLWQRRKFVMHIAASAASVGSSGCTCYMLLHQASLHSSRIQNPGA